MSKKTNLAEAFSVSEDQLQRRSPEIAVVETPAKETEKPKRRHIGGYFDEAVYRQVKIVGAEKGLSTQAILTEALNAFFRMHDKPPIA